MEPIESGFFFFIVFFTLVVMSIIAGFRAWIAAKGYLHVIVCSGSLSAVLFMWFGVDWGENYNTNPHLINGNAEREHTSEDISPSTATDFTFTPIYQFIDETDAQSFRALFKSEQDNSYNPKVLTWLPSKCDTWGYRTKRKGFDSWRLVDRDKAQLYAFDGKNVIRVVFWASTKGWQINMDDVDSRDYRDDLPGRPYEILNHLSNTYPWLRDKALNVPRYANRF